MSKLDHLSPMVDGTNALLIGQPKSSRTPDVVEDEVMMKISPGHHPSHMAVTWLPEVKLPLRSKITRPFPITKVGL